MACYAVAFDTRPGNFARAGRRRAQSNRFRAAADPTVATGKRALGVEPQQDGLDQTTPAATTAGCAFV